MDTVIIIFGVIATMASTYLGFRFLRIKNALGRNIALMAFGGALAGFCTLVFSYASWVGEYASLPDWATHLLRLGIFSGMTVADVLMLARIKRIENGDG